MPEMMLNSAEDPRVRVIEEKLSEIEDYQLLNKLDVIAIKEQLEHIEKLSAALTPETQQRLSWVEQITKSDKFQSIEKLIDEVHNIESSLEQSKKGLSAEQIESLKNEISNKVAQDVSSLRQRLENAPMGKIAVPVNAQFDASALESEIQELRTKIAKIENMKTAGPHVELTDNFKQEIMGEFDAKLQASANKIYSEMRSSVQTASKAAQGDADKSVISDLKNEIESVKSDIRSDLDAKFADLESRIKPAEGLGLKEELKAEVERISDSTMRDLNEKMNQLQRAMSSTGMEETKREIYEDFHKFKISIIDQISNSAEEVENKVMPQIASWRSEADKALQKNKDAYAELVKFKISTMDEMNKKTKEIKESVMLQVPAEIHSMRTDVDNKMQKFESQISEIKMLKSDVEDFRKKLERSKVGELDKLTGEVERVKARSEWLEDELLKKDITAINERMNELETELQRTKAMVPIVLE
ncbi:MAG: hypothetical protein HY515_00775 [Candidatus Aenigmarchaeota archaeon]|nr:hypothetical protein [Candidatus Aenigmarchaeota archaeon]